MNKQCVNCKYVVDYGDPYTDCRVEAARTYPAKSISNFHYLTSARTMRTGACGPTAKLFSPNLTTRVITFFKDLTK